jgi:hypothetical protein
MGFNSLAWSRSQNLARRRVVPCEDRNNCIPVSGGASVRSGAFASGAQSEFPLRNEPCARHRRGPRNSQFRAIHSPCPL